MSSDTSERGFQQDIVDYLSNYGGYVDRTIYNDNREVKLYKNSHYNKNTCLDMELTLNFIIETQPKAWEKFNKIYGDVAAEKFIDGLIRELDKKGTINVLRNGFRDSGTSFKLFYPKPNSNLNNQTIENYSSNVFSVIQELDYEKREKGNRVDIVIFINGLPISTIELKDSFSQGVSNAMKQYQDDRDPNEKLFKNCLVHFAMSDEKIYMTTKLKGRHTVFLPFNKGLTNPDVEGFYRTSYLYTEILEKDQLSNIISNFVFYEKNEDGTKEDKLIFPRFHQLACVNMLLSEARPGQNYLIQHSAGSGKTKTIAWLADGLKNLFDENGERIYDMIIIVSDRRVIDKQLQDQMLAIQKTDGVVKKIDKNSKQLVKALIGGKNIIVSTIHKFSFITEEISKIPNRSYAIIVDEAHSSQSGTHSRNLRQAISNKDFSDYEEEDIEDEIDQELIEEMEKVRTRSNISFFGFTATPKDKTLELFGKKDEFGEFHPHHLYSMKQAIEEGFILNVLENYFTYPTYWKLIKTVEEDPEFDKKEAIRVLKSYVEEHPHAISEKVKIILEQFNRLTKYKIKGKARAMVVTKSRKQAVLYKLEFDKQIKADDKFKEIKPLVAFSGTVKDGDLEYTENNMNHIDCDIKEALKEDPYKILVVADKFQTGFDEPLLHTMFVDKKLGGVKAVQTLSRVNRIHDDKDDTLILDFANDKEEIQRAFQPFYEETYLKEETDYHKLYDLRDILLDYHIFTDDDINEFVKAYKSNVKQHKLHELLNHVIDKFNLMDDDSKKDFKKTMRRFQSIYGFMSQILPFNEIYFEKMYIYNKYLYKKLPTKNNPLPFSVLNDVDMESYRIDTSDDGSSIELISAGGLIPAADSSSKYKPGEKKKLSEIIDVLNEKFGVGLTDEHNIILKQIADDARKDNELQTIIANNTRENVNAIFFKFFDKMLNKIFKNNIDFYKIITKNNKLKEEISREILDMLYEEKDK